MKILVRMMTTEDIDSVHEIESSCFNPPWTKDAFHDEVTKNNLARYVVAEADGKVVGYGGMWLIINEAHITNIAVAESMRRHHVGSVILEMLMQIAWDVLEITQMTLEVRKSNYPAQKLYRKYGFANAGERVKYYDNGEDAIIMWCRDTRPYIKADNEQPSD